MVFSFISWTNRSLVYASKECCSFSMEMEEKIPGDDPFKERKCPPMIRKRHIKMRLIKPAESFSLNFCIKAAPVRLFFEIYEEKPAFMKRISAQAPSYGSIWAHNIGKKRNYGARAD